MHLPSLDTSIAISLFSFFGFAVLTTLHYSLHTYSRTFGAKKLNDRGLDPFLLVLKKITKFHFEKLFFLCLETQAALYLTFGISSIILSMTYYSTFSPLTIIYTLFAILITQGIIVPRFFLPYIQGMVSIAIGRIASIYLFLACPISFIIYIFMLLFIRFKGFLRLYSEESFSKENLMSFIKEAEHAHIISEHDNKLLQAVLSFRDRIAREVMMPRVDLFCVPHDMSIRDTAELLKKEGYSRVPVYKNTQDHIVGILMYKDILSKYMECVQQKQDFMTLDTPVEHIMKSVLYTPETKKISLLLQEFKKKKTHLAIVVDEYGGTSGIVTIEDILEEIVGEIADEYDEAESFFKPIGKNSWIVDARVSLLDLEEELHIHIPQEGEYDTLMGYIFYRLGAIPQKGVIIHHDEYELEIIRSDERTVEKVKITLLELQKTN